MNDTNQDGYITPSSLPNEPSSNSVKTGTDCAPCRYAETARIITSIVLVFSITTMVIYSYHEYEWNREWDDQHVKATDASNSLVETEDKLTKMEIVNRELFEMARANLKLSGALSMAANRIAQLEYKRDVITSELAELWKLSSELKKLFLSQDGNTSVSCQIVYKDKCFGFHANPTGESLSLEQGRQICKSLGGSLANIYSRDHYYMLLGFLRMLSSKDGTMSAWTGMKYNITTRSTIFSDGITQAPFVRWHPGYPRVLTCCGMYLYARADHSNPNQHLHTALSTAMARKVICEK